MSENFPTSPSPEELAAQEAEENRQRVEDYISRHPDPKIIEADAKKESGPAITEFKELLASFESEHSILELYAITDLAPDEMEAHEVRQKAKAALIPVFNKMKALENETDISPEKYQELKAKYKYLARAIGTINNGKVDHTR